MGDNFRTQGRDVEKEHKEIPYVAVWMHCRGSYGASSVVSPIKLIPWMLEFHVSAGLSPSYST